MLNAFCRGHGGGWCWTKQPISDFGIFRIYCSRIFAISIISRWRNTLGLWPGWMIGRQLTCRYHLLNNTMQESLLLRINAACSARCLLRGCGGRWSGPLDRKTNTTWIGKRTRQHRRRQGPKEARPSSQRGCVIWSARHERLSRAGLIVSFLPWPHAILNLWEDKKEPQMGGKWRF